MGFIPLSTTDFVGDCNSQCKNIIPPIIPVFLVNINVYQSSARAGNVSE